MTGVILAAGTGSRLRPFTDAVPKCLLSVGGRTILQRTLENLLASRIEEILIVTGYRSHQVREHVSSRFRGLEIRLLENPKYESTNNIHSLWMALRGLPGSGGLVLLDSDLVFDGRILDLLLQSGHDNCLALGSHHGLGEEEVKVVTRPDGCVSAIGKWIPVGTAAGESVGIELFGERGVAALREALESLVVDRGCVDLFYESAFQELIEGGLPIHAVDVGGLLCREIDTQEDLVVMRQLIGG